VTARHRLPLPRPARRTIADHHVADSRPAPSRRPPPPLPRAAAAAAARRRCRCRAPPLPRAAAAAAARRRCRILIDNARKKQSDKRGGQQQRAPFHDNIAAPMKATDDLLAIDEALTALAEEDAESAQLVKLRFYAGLSVEEAADVMGLPRASAYRTWNYAKAWLQTKLGDM
jgi:DNA-directed RNA polymerase specialized sigma24 family protein